MSLFTFFQKIKNPCFVGKRVSKSIVFVKFYALDKVLSVFVIPFSSKSKRIWLMLLFRKTAFDKILI